ncbi:PAS domain S-box protein [Roseixanthobacter liquoris]|uniref:PAS domain S-box protein n=1 Tax=Roseixanthobacter liquoris TaxID=3119921 RepID=UPI00372CCB37
MQRTEQQFTLLVQSVTDYAIYMLDPDGRIASWNRGAQRFKGYEAEEVLGQHVSLFYTEEDRRADIAQHALRIASETGRFESEGQRVRKDGSKFWAHVVIDAIHDKQGNLLGFAKITRDITERRESERALEETRRALFQAQKMEAVGQLTGGIAHDFNNLLTVILGGLDSIGRQLQFLEDSSIKARITRSREMALTGAQRAASLTSRLLAFSRQQPLAPRALDVNKLVSGVTDLLRQTLGEAISLEMVLGGGVWPTFIDGNQLESALINLAINARDAMSQGGKLTIETVNADLSDAYVAALTEPVAPGQYVLIAVTDTGVGMDTATLEKVFEPFFTTKAAGKGTGLGLSQVYGFIRQSSGHVKLYSETGIGTTVKLYLPRYFGSVEASSDHGGTAAAHAVGAECILVVEDDDALRGYATEMLRELGYRVLEAGNGIAALGVLAQHPEVDLLFTDVIMPGGINGRQLADQAQVRQPGLKVLFTTGYTRNAIVHNGQLDTGVELISKPYSFDQLAAKVRRSLDAK